MRTKKKRTGILQIIIFCYVISVFTVILSGIVWYYWYSNIKHKDTIYPAVSIDGVSFGGKTKQEVIQYWLEKNAVFSDASITLAFEDQTATITGVLLELGYDATLSATQAFLVGRSQYYASNFNDRLLKKKIELTPVLQWNKEAIQSTIQTLKETIDVPSENALFRFSGGKVLSFKPSKNGRMVSTQLLTESITKSLIGIASGKTKNPFIQIPVETTRPTSATTDVNTFGIKDLIGKGYSVFTGSIPGRIHNVSLAAAKLNGILIKPGDTFSFNDALGDISAATGYQSAYIIKDGRTVMGDGGGVCQVSTTLFRAALNAGLPIVERHEHSYRVHYYEDGGFKPGLDATVFDPSYDLKIKNDTPAHILIQTFTDTENLTLTFELYGTSDGRKAEIYNHNVWGITAPPPNLYQDDPTLQKGVVKQVDFSSWGAKSSFQYKVIRDGQTILEETFHSNYRPWQAVFLRGTKE